MKNGSWSVLVAVLLVAFAGMARAQETHNAGQNAAEMKFVNFPGLPTCMKGAFMDGDPSKGPSIVLAKGTAGCTVPWHWHTPTERVMIVIGTVRMEMKDGKAVTLHAGGFSLVSPHHPHQAHCATACTMFVYGDAAFDIHYVDKEGNEISPDDALKAVKEKTIKPAS